MFNCFFVFVYPFVSLLACLCKRGLWEARQIMRDGIGIINGLTTLISIQTNAVVIEKFNGCLWASLSDGGAE